MMTVPLRFELVEATFERAEADLAVAGFFRDELPLRGGAGRVDWRLCGLISEQLLAGRMSGDPEEALLLPSEGRFRSPRVLIVGLGTRDAYRQPQVASCARNVFLRSAALGVRSLALPPLGFEPDDFSRCAAAFLQGAVEGGDACRHPIDVRLVIPEEDHASARRALHDAARAMNRPELVPASRISQSSHVAAAPLRPASSS